MDSITQDWFGGYGANVEQAVRCAVNTLIGGALGFYVRALYKRFGSSLSNRESFGNLFPILTAITVVIIFVVKSSLALSLGLVGALSIVRFRTAIKDPEELVYLFLCIGMGVSLGAELRLLTLLSVLIVSGFIIGQHWLPKGKSDQNLLLTVSGDAGKFFDKSGTSPVDLISQLSRRVDVQRFDLEDGQVQFRARVSLQRPQDVTELVSSLRSQLPGFHVSYVNLDTLM